MSCNEDIEVCGLTSSGLESPPQFDPVSVMLNTLGCKCSFFSELDLVFAMVTLKLDQVYIAT